MTNTEIRTAIAERCGWTLEKTNDRDGKCWHLNGIQSEEAPPDYPNDLNAMHEAAVSLNQKELSIYRKILADLTCPKKPTKYFRTALDFVSAAIDATARQRAESFLKTKGGWKE